MNIGKLNLVKDFTCTVIFHSICIEWINMAFVQIFYINKPTYHWKIVFSWVPCREQTSTWANQSNFWNFGYQIRMYREQFWRFAVVQVGWPQIFRKKVRKFGNFVQVIWYYRDLEVFISWLPGFEEILKDEYWLISGRTGQKQILGTDQIIWFEIFNSGRPLNFSQIITLSYTFIWN